MIFIRCYYKISKINLNTMQKSIIQVISHTTYVQNKGLFQVFMSPVSQYFILKQQ